MVFRCNGRLLQSWHFEKENNLKLYYTIGARRAGAAAAIYAGVEKANTVLQWKAEKNITDMVKDAWRWELALHTGLKK